MAFQYGIYAVKRGIYPFVTPESRSGRRARAEADVTHKTQKEERKSSTSTSPASPQQGGVDNEHVGKTEA